MDHLLLESDTDKVKEYISMLKEYVNFCDIHNVFATHDLPTDIESKLDDIMGDLDDLWWDLSPDEVKRANVISIEYNKERK